MKQIERDLIATAYANAWKAVKKSDCTVIAKPNGWFETKVQSYHHAFHRNRRADELLEGLNTLIKRLAEQGEELKGENE